MPLKRLLLFCMLCLSATTADAQGKTNEELTDLVQVDVTLTNTNLAPGDSTAAHAVFHIKNGWHIYSDPPGDAGLPTRLLIKGTDVLTPGKIDYPKPEAATQNGNIKVNVYSGSLDISLPMSVSPDVKPGSSLPFEIQARWLACDSDVCVPGNKTFKQEVTFQNKK